jgi:hypothetical protein
MSTRSQLTTSINKFGKSVTILRTAANITEKEMVVKGFAYAVEKTPFPQAASYFIWDSEVELGDICQEVLSGKRKLISALEFLGVDGSRAGYRAIEIECNDYIILYELVPTGVIDEYGKKNYNATVRLSDFACVFHNVRGDALAPIGEIDKNEIVVIFSARNLGDYVPKEGNRIVTQDGSQYQIDGVDSHIYPGSYRTLCTPDQRTE